jgi:hypothetical protein
VNSKNVLGRFGFEEQQSFPCTFGMNDKGGMNSVKLEKYMKGSILPLYPDVQDIPGKRVIVKVDSGPGRMNVNMLAEMRLRGIYLVPGVPSTTGQTQETDQNYASYKTVFRSHLRVLTQTRHDRGFKMRVSDLPLLVFGGKCPQTGLELCDSFSEACGIARNLACGK